MQQSSYFFTFSYMEDCFFPLFQKLFLCSITPYGSEYFSDEVDMRNDTWRRGERQRGKKCCKARTTYLRELQVVQNCGLHARGPHCFKFYMPSPGGIKIKRVRGLKVSFLLHRDEHFSRVQLGRAQDCKVGSGHHISSLPGACLISLAAWDKHDQHHQSCP